jgi:hypothetical protein
MSIAVLGDSSLNIIQVWFFDRTSTQITPNKMLSTFKGAAIYLSLLTNLETIILRLFLGSFAI